MNSSNQALSPVTFAIDKLLRSCCTHPDKLDVSERSEGTKLRIFARPDGRDHPILVGKLGRTVNATRVVAAEAGKRVGFSDVHLDVIHSFDGLRAEAKAFAFNPKFECEEMRPVLEPILSLLFDKGWDCVSFEQSDDRVRVILDLPPTALSAVMALGAAIYPYGFRLGRKLSFRIKGLTSEQVNRTL